MAGNDNGKTNKEMGNVDDDEMSTISQIEASKKKGGKKKLLFILVPLILILGGGGFAAYHFLFAKKSKTPVNKLVTLSNIQPGPMIKLKSFLTNLANTNRTAYVKVSMSIELKPGSNVGIFKQLTPKVRNRIIMILSSKTSKEIDSPQGQLSLRHQIARSLNQLLGDDTVTGVYFNNYLVQ
jgi:flagellar FliL protein